MLPKPSYFLPHSIVGVGLSPPEYLSGGRQVLVLLQNGPRLADVGTRFLHIDVWILDADRLVG